MTTAHDKLVAFFYLLIRDEVTPGTIEKIMDDTGEGGTGYKFSNEYLARYAADLAWRFTDEARAAKEES